MPIEKIHNLSYLPHRGTTRYINQVRNNGVVDGNGQVIGSGGESMFWKN